MDVTFIIINYNTRHFLEPCLASIERHVTGLEYEIIVVDNASRDGSVGFIQQAYPGIKLIQNDQNQGFAKANNQAVEIAEGDFLFLLNADTILLDDGLSRAISYLKENQVAVLGPKLVNEDKTLQVSFQKENNLNRHIFDIFSLAFPVRRLLSPKRKKTVAAPATPCEMGFLVGAALIIDARVVKKFGLFDESYFFIGEERDFCLKMLQKNQKIVYFPDFQIVHFGGSGDPHSTFHLMNWFKASCTLAQKHGSFLHLILIKIGLSCFYISRAVIFLFKILFSRQKDSKENTGLAKKYSYLFLWSIGWLHEKRIP
jgi:GT2 family glycosyltransferase